MRGGEGGGVCVHDILRKMSCRQLIAAHPPNSHDTSHATQAQSKILQRRWTSITAGA